MHPRWYRWLRIGSVVAFSMMALGLAGLRIFAYPPPAPSASDAVATPPPRRGACRGWHLLVGHDNRGAPRRAYVPATVGGKVVAMELDTGSATSYVLVDRDDDRTRHEVRIGGELRVMPGRHTQLDPDVYGMKERGGLEVRGTLGAEEVLGGTTDIDLRRGCLTRHPRGSRIDQASSWPTLGFSVVNDVIVTTVSIDGEARPALFDTGVGHSILVTDRFAPFATHQVVHDVRGIAIDLYGREGTVRWGLGPVEPVWVERTPRFDTFYDMKLGEVHMMAGISSMGLRRIIVDPVRKVLLLEPLE
jgi:hypothetical protein